MTESKKALIVNNDSSELRILSFKKDDSGNVDMDLARQYFKKHFLSETKDIDNVIIDLEGLSSIDSSSLGPIVQKHKDSSLNNGKVILCNITSSSIEEVLALTRLDTILTIHPSLESAKSVF